MMTEALRTLVLKIDVKQTAGLVTCIIVAVLALYAMSDLADFSGERRLLALALFALFIALFLWVTSGERGDTLRFPETAALASMFLLANGISLVVPFTFTAILIAVWATVLMHFVPLQPAIRWSPTWMLPHFLIYQFYWQHPNAWMSSLLFCCLNLGFLVMVNAQVEATKAKQQAQQLNRELLATQHLLLQAAEQGERLRISRNIHDLLGHHLTALTIHLQVLTRQTESQAQERAEQCHAIAKLLLSDVREAVSEIREKSDIELAPALHLLLDSVPRLQTSIQCEVNLQDVALVDVILKSVQEGVTNTLKHGQASHFSVTVQQREEVIQIAIADNGKVTAPIVLGNGLQGMQERIAAVQGQVVYSGDENGFAMTITLPRKEA